VQELITIDENEPVVEVAKTMAENKISSVVVTSKGEPYGIITERDIVIRVDAQCEELKKIKCKEIASSPMVTIDSGAPIFKATRLMEEKHLKKLLAVNSAGEVIGIVSMTDLLKSVTAIFDVIDVMKQFF
jgi:CBS domain-containing protein